MKKTTIFLILSLMLVLMPSCLFAANYVQIYNDNNYLIYLDTSSIQDQGSYYKAWTKTEYRGENLKRINDLYKKEVGYILFLDVYAKETKQTSSLAGYVYAKDGSLIESYNHENYPFSWKSVIPDTVGEDIFDAVCSYAGKQ